MGLERIGSHNPWEKAGLLIEPIGVGRAGQNKPIEKIGMLIEPIGVGITKRKKPIEKNRSADRTDRGLKAAANKKLGFCQS